MSKRLTCDECQGNGYIVLSKDYLAIDRDADGEFVGDAYWAQDFTQELCGTCHGTGKVIAVPQDDYEWLQSELSDLATMVQHYDRAMDWLAAELSDFHWELSNEIAPRELKEKALREAKPSE